MALNVANWTDKQLDELADLLKTADYSAVAAFISENFLCIGSRIMTDPSATTLRGTVNGTDAKCVDISAGIFQHASKIGQLDSTQTCNILNTTYGSWGTGQAAGAGDRWSIICVKQADLAHTAALRWFVDDSVSPNTYSQQSVNTLINKAYYGIVVVHGADGGPVPATPAGYWCIAEVFVPAGATSILQTNIYDTGDPRGSQAAVPNWTTISRVLRLEFWSTLFGIDHDMATGYHKEGLWHIGATPILVTGVELNQALDGIGGTVTAPNLTALTDGSNVGSMHIHGGTSNLQNVYNASSVALGSSYANITGMEITCILTTTASILLMYQAENDTDEGDYIRFTKDGAATGQEWKSYGKNGDAFLFQTVELSLVPGTYVFRIQGKKAGISGSLSKNTFTVLTL